MEVAQKQDLGELREALSDGRIADARAIIAALNPAETALVLESLPPAERPTVWDLCDECDEGDILAQLNDEVRTLLAQDMGADALVAATEGLDIDDLADIVADLPEEISDKVMESLSTADREQLESVLSYPEHSAGGLMDPDTRSVRSDVTLEVVMRYLRRAGDLPDETPAVFVVDRDDKYIGVLYFSRLVTRDPEQIVSDVMDNSVAAINANRTDIEVACDVEGPRAARTTDVGSEHLRDLRRLQQRARLRLLRGTSGARPDDERQPEHDRHDDTRRTALRPHEPPPPTGF